MTVEQEGQQLSALWPLEPLVIGEVKDEEEWPEKEKGEETDKPKEHWNVQLVLVVDLPTQENNVGRIEDGPSHCPEGSQRYPVLQFEVGVGDENYAGDGEENCNQLGEGEPVCRRAGKDGRQ